MNRRGFLKALGRGSVAALVLAHVPTAAIQSVGLAEPARERAIEFLRRAWLAHVKGNPLNAPRRGVVGRDLLEAYEAELNDNGRFVVVAVDSFRHGTGVMFKGTPLFSQGRGWRVEFQS